MKSGTYLIIGIGRFGTGFYKRLLKEEISPKNIYCVDRSKDNLTGPSEAGIDNIFEASITTISDLDNIIAISFIDNIIIGTSDLEDSVSIVSSILKLEDIEKKNVYVKSRNRIHSLILNTLGIPLENIVIPEEEVGSKIALKSLFHSKIDVLDLGEQFSLFSMEFMAIPLINKTIQEMCIEWNKFYGKREWTIILITGINGVQRIPINVGNIKIGERITFCTVKSDRKKIYQFFSRKK
ncbi:MAG: NAD-binding protein [Mycoplasmoidaceae bacterium]